MEDPATEIKDVIRGLVCKPTLDQQERILRRYFAEDCKFFHSYANVEHTGLRDVISLYQLAETGIRYQSVEFLSVLYDPCQDLLSVRMNVRVQPWRMLYKDVELELFVLFELEEFESGHGRKLKRVKVQRDYFQRSPVLLMVPVIGDVYGSRRLRTFLGRVDALLFRVMRRIFKFIF